MADSELEAIRRARLAELQANQGGRGSGNSGSNAAGGSAAGSSEANAQEESRLSILSQVLSAEARERLSRIRIVRGDKARGVEDMIIRMAQTGQIRQKVSEKELVSLLDQISQQESKSTTKIIFDRRDGDIVGSASSENKSAAQDVDDDDDDFFD